MAIHVNIGEAKTRLSQLVAASLEGEEVVLARAGKPVAKIVPLPDAAHAERAERAKRIKAWIGSGNGKLSANAGDLFLEPSFSEAELNAIERELDF